MEAEKPDSRNQMETFRAKKRMKCFRTKKESSESEEEKDDEHMRYFN